jgi:ArsR family transcriptional regulator, arsenate/arsenite/antimonite-responsive transcriptional repressor
LNAMMPVGSKKPRDSTPPPRGGLPDKAVERTLLVQLSQIFQMLADPSRLKILLALAKNGEMHVTELRDLLGQSQPAVSHHLRLLRIWNLVNFRRDGKHNYYRVDSTYLGSLLEQVFSDSGHPDKQIEFQDFCLNFARKAPQPVL